MRTQKKSVLVTHAARREDCRSVQFGEDQDANVRVSRVLLVDADRGRSSLFLAPRRDIVQSEDYLSYC